MALIEVDEPPASRTASGFDAESVVAALDSLLGEELFTVLTGDGVAEPNLIALDASGTAVAVDLIEQLNSETLLRAMNHAGIVGRMSRGELAARYPGGLERFQHELGAYLNSVPYRRPKASGSGSRLVIVCGSADPEVWPAVNFLNQPDAPARVLKANSLQALDGRSFVDVSPLVFPVAPVPQVSPMPNTSAVVGDRPAAAPLLTRAERRRQEALQASASAGRVISRPETITVIERAKSALAAADHFLAQPRKPQLSRKQLRERGQLGAQLAESQVEITGVLALGTAPNDHLSWDTTNLPVIARPAV